MAKEIYNKVSQLYYKTNAKRVPPVIMLEKPAIKKIVGLWVEIILLVMCSKHNKDDNKQNKDYQLLLGW